MQVHIHGAPDDGTMFNIGDQWQRQRKRISLIIAVALVCAPAPCWCARAVLVHTRRVGARAPIRVHIKLWRCDVAQTMEELRTPPMWTASRPPKRLEILYR